MRIIIYGKEGDGGAFSAIGQIKSVCSSMGVESTIQIVTDPHMHGANGVSALPAIEIDGLMVSMGYMPSRMEIERAIKQKIGRR
jgi:hypothetical protein